MSAHVAAHRWADAFAGSVAEPELARMEEHAAGCPACARARDRVQRASHSFSALRAQQAPELPWDRVRAQIHWSVSSDRRAKQHTPHRVAPGAIVLAAAAAAGLAAILGGAFASEHTRPGSERAATVAPAVSPAPAPLAPTPHGALVVRELGEQVMVNGMVRRRIFEEVLAQGAVIATGASRVDIQFDDRSAFSLGPSSALTIARLDSERIELHLDEGTLDVALRRRSPEQRFVVVAGTRSIEVRGTQFRVHRDEHDTTRVACAHGKVAVRDAAGEIELDAARAIDLSAAAKVGDVAIATLTDVERADLAHAMPITLPVWTDPAQLVATSAALEVTTAAARDVRIDGVEVGQGPLRLRVMPGRHTVETADGAGRFQRAGWVDVTAGTPARLAVHAAATPTGGAAARKKQLASGLDRAKLAQCTRSITKAGLSNTFVHVELAVAESGAIEFLNVIDTDLPARTADCVRDVISSVRFASGPAATLRYRVDL